MQENRTIALLMYSNSDDVAAEVHGETVPVGVMAPGGVMASVGVMVLVGAQFWGRPLFRGQ